MQVTLFSYLWVVLATAAVAAPAPFENGLAPRWSRSSSPRLAYSPHWPRDERDNRNNNDNNDQSVQITQTEVTIQNNSGDEESVFQKKVTQIIVKNNDSNDRKNKERSRKAKENNNDKTTIIQVVQTIIQVNNDGSRGKRYAMSQLTANPGSSETTTYQVSDAENLTVGECRSLSGAAEDATATAVEASATAGVADAANAAATNDVSAPFLQSNQTMLMAEGAAPPEVAAGVGIMEDPAAAILNDISNIC